MLIKKFEWQICLRNLFLNRLNRKWFRSDVENSCDLIFFGFTNFLILNIIKNKYHVNSRTKRNLTNKYMADDI